MRSIAIGRAWTVPIGLLIALAMSETTSIAVVQTRYTIADVANHGEDVTDPGAAPAFDRADYPATLRSGTGTLAGAPLVSLKNGGAISCTTASGLQVYPDTPYVHWMLRKWLYTIATSGVFVRPAGIFSIPAALDPYNDATIVRGATCENGSFVINDLPLGKYIVLAVIIPTYVDHYTTSVMSQAPDPNGGPPHVSLDDTPHTVVLTTPDLFVASVDVHFAHPNETIAIPSSTWTTLIHTAFEVRYVKTKSHRKK